MGKNAATGVESPEYSQTAASCPSEAVARVKEVERGADRERCGVSTTHTDTCEHAFSQQSRFQLGQTVLKFAAADRLSEMR